MKSYNEIMKECENIDLFLKGKTILKIKWWADSNDLSPTLIFTDGSSIDVIGKALNYNLKKINQIILSLSKNLPGHTVFAKSLCK